MALRNPKTGKFTSEVSEDRCAIVVQTEEERWARLMEAKRVKARIEKAKELRAAKKKARQEAWERRQARREEAAKVRELRDLEEPRVSHEELTYNIKI